MKTLILSLTLLGFVAAAHAGDNTKTVQNDKPACCAKMKTMAAEKAQCPVMAAKQEKAACCKNKQMAKQSLQSPKALAQAR